LLRTGLDLDRAWMFVHDDMKFLTIRENAKMTLINTSISDDDELVAEATSIDPAATFRIPAHPTRTWLEENTELRTVQIWKNETDAWIYPAALTAAFRDIFGRNVRLALKGPSPRPLSGNAAAHRLGRTESARFPDLTPLMISNQRSVAELNTRLGAALTIERFRPNLIVDGEAAWCEDRWKTLRLGAGGPVIDVTSRCGRCQVPNVDPDTGDKHKLEPFSTLMKYRRIDQGLPYTPCFGMLCVPRDEGDVAVGMEVDIIEETDAHKYVSGLS
jgi:hypothetical protein